MNHKLCTLSIALLLFYNADGVTLLNDDFELDDYSFTQEWYNLVNELYNKILSGSYKKGITKYEIPLTNIHKYKYRKLGINEIFLTDV